MKSKSKRSEIFLILSLIIQFAIVIYIKYDNQFLSLNNFNLFLLGNILTTIFYLLLIVEIVLLYNKYRIKMTISVLFIIFSFLFLGLGYYSNKVQMPFNQYYFFGQYGNKLFTGLCFTLYISTIFYFAFYILLSKKSQPIINLKALLLTVISMLLFLLFSYSYILYNENTLNGKHIVNDKKVVLVVLGAAVWSDNKPSPILAARVDKSAELTKNRNVYKIYFTGGNAPGEKSEAEVAFNYFQSLNSDFNNVELETLTSSTNEQIQFIKNKILPLYPEYEIIVISDSFHLVRIMEISNFHQIKIKTVASDFSMSIGSNIYNRIRESLALSVFWFFSI